jgi:hypothetical protein
MDAKWVVELVLIQKLTKAGSLPIDDPHLRN